MANKRKKSGSGKVIPSSFRPSAAEMQRVSNAAKKAFTVGKSSSNNPKHNFNKASLPKVIGTRKSSEPAKTLAKKSPKKMTSSAGKAKAKSPVKKPRNRSATGAAAKVLVAGRHIPPNMRYKTGYWRPVRQSWMSQEVWDAVKAMNRFRQKAMSKGLAKASLGKQIYGARGPGHAGYGTGELQKWTDMILRRDDGSDPHFVNLLDWFKGAAAALDYHNGERNFDQLLKESKKDPEHMMRYIVQRFQDMIPELRKLSKRGMNDLIKSKFYTAQYGPDGRAK